jgi:hypothetical protein
MYPVTPAASAAAAAAAAAPAVSEVARLSGGLATLYARLSLVGDPSPPATPSPTLSPPSLPLPTRVLSVADLAAECATSPSAKGCRPPALSLGDAARYVFSKARISIGATVATVASRLWLPRRLADPASCVSSFSELRHVQAATLSHIAEVLVARGAQRSLLLRDEWLRVAYAHVVWFLASVEHHVGPEAEGAFLVTDKVVGLLAARYEAEHCAGRRSLLQQWEAQSRPLAAAAVVVVASDPFEIDVAAAQSTVAPTAAAGPDEDTDDGGAQRACAGCDHTMGVLLSDGHRTTVAFLHDRMIAAFRDGFVRPGTKLQLMNGMRCDVAPPVLQAALTAAIPADLLRLCWKDGDDRVHLAVPLHLSANSTMVAPPRTPLGAPRDTHFFVPLSLITLDGGLVAPLRVRVERVRSLVWLDRSTDPSITRSQAEEESYRDHLARRYEDLYVAIDKLAEASKPSSLDGGILAKVWADRDGTDIPKAVVRMSRQTCAALLASYFVGGSSETDAPAFLDDISPASRHALAVHLRLARSFSELAFERSVSPMLSITVSQGSHEIDVIVWSGAGGLWQEVKEGHTISLFGASVTLDRFSNAQSLKLSGKGAQVTIEAGEPNPYVLARPRVCRTVSDLAQLTDTSGSPRDREVDGIFLVTAVTPDSLSITLVDESSTASLDLRFSSAPHFRLVTSRIGSALSSRTCFLFLVDAVVQAPGVAYVRSQTRVAVSTRLPTFPQVATAHLIQRFVLLQRWANGSSQPSSGAPARVQPPPPTPDILDDHRGSFVGRILFLPSLARRILPIAGVPTVMLATVPMSKADDEADTDPQGLLLPVDAGLYVGAVFIAAPVLGRLLDLLWVARGSDVELSLNAWRTTLPPAQQDMSVPEALVSSVTKLASSADGPARLALSASLSRVLCDRDVTFSISSTSDAPHILVVRDARPTSFGV